MKKSVTREDRCAQTWINRFDDLFTWLVEKANWSGKKDQKITSGRSNL